ncbi:MAG: RadC family protein [Alphaproteobacteria bacterium]
MKPSLKIEPKPHYLGHRKRLRERFLKGEAHAMPDYEVLELLLFLAQPRGDLKPLAKALLEACGGSFASVISASQDKLRRVKGMGESSIVALKTVQEGARRLLLEELRQQPLLNSSEKVVNYCHAIMAHLEIEQFRLLFLDRKNFLIADEVQQKGTIDHTPLYVREVMKRALELGAGGLIMVHNHPTGDPTPSQADINITKNLNEAAKQLEIRLLDHLIIGKYGYTSFREKGLF